MDQKYPDVPDGFTRPTGKEKEYQRVADLFKFYQVKSEGQLILAMDEHISRLQEKLRKYQPQQQVRTKVREG